MPDGDETRTEEGDGAAFELEPRHGLVELEAALTVAAAAPGRRRLERLEQLLLVRASLATRD